VRRSSCNTGGCSPEHIWGLLRPDGRLARFSFSHSVLTWVNNQALEGRGRIQRFRFLRGLPIPPGGTSRSGLYAIVAERGSKGRVLRVCYSKEAADFFREPGARSIHEFWLAPETLALRRAA